MRKHILEECRLLASILLRLALVVLVVYLCRVAAGLPGEIRAAREEVAQTLQASLNDLTAQTAPVLRESERTIKAARETVKSARVTLREVNETMRAARPVIGDVQIVVQDVSKTVRSADTAIIELGKLRADLKPVLASADEVLMQTSGTVAVVRPQFLGLAAAAKVTFGEAAQAARRIDAAMPQLLTRIDRIAQNSDRTTAASAGLFKHLEEATKPLPKWLRYPLSVTGAIAPTAAGAFGIAASAGAFR